MRFPIKGTVFAVFFLLTINFLVYLKPAQAENTVTFKMVILPAKENVVGGIGVNPFRISLLKNKRVPNIPVVFFQENWNIFYRLQNR